MQQCWYNFWKYALTAKNCSEKPHPAISVDLKFPISKLARRKMKVNEVSCQQRLKCCSPTSGHRESLRGIWFGDSCFYRRPVQKPGRCLSKPSNRPLMGVSLRTSSVSLGTHLMLELLLNSKYEIQYKTFNLMNDEGTNKTKIIAFFLSNRLYKQ